MRKKILALLLALLVCGSLAACGGGSQTAKKTEEVQSTKSSDKLGDEETEEETEFTEPVPTAQTKTDHCELERICVDRSYTDKDNSSLKIVYVFYTVSTQNQNLKVSSKLSQLIFDSGNSYSSEHLSKSCTGYMPSYYNSNYI